MGTHSNLRRHGRTHEQTDVAVGPRHAIPPSAQRVTANMLPYGAVPVMSNLLLPPPVMYVNGLGGYGNFSRGGPSFLKTEAMNKRPLSDPSPPPRPKRFAEAHLDRPGA